MKPQWQSRAWDVHQRYISQTQATNAFTSDAEVIHFLGLAIGSEAGELTNRITKMWRGDSVPSEELRHGIAHLRICLNLLATHLEIDIDTASEEKLEFVAQRIAHQEAKPQ